MFTEMPISFHSQHMSLLCISANDVGTRPGVFSVHRHHDLSYPSALQHIKTAFSV
jgi:hypothetical protein